MNLNDCPMGQHPNWFFNTEKNKRKPALVPPAPPPQNRTTNPLNDALSSKEQGICVKKIRKAGYVAAKQLLPGNFPERYLSRTITSCAMPSSQRNQETKKKVEHAELEIRQACAGPMRAPCRSLPFSAQISHTTFSTITRAGSGYDKIDCKTDTDKDFMLHSTGAPDDLQERFCARKSSLRQVWSLV